MPYDNSRRAETARKSRVRVLESARELFLSKGYAATTIRAVATAAGVSQESVYKSFGGKAGLLKQVYDVTLAGDAELSPIADRPEAQAVRLANSPAAAAIAYAELAALLAVRTEPLLAVVRAAGDADDGLTEFAAVLETERLTGAAAASHHWSTRGWLRPELTVGQARDVMWTLNSPAVYARLRGQGWLTADYTDWLARTLAATVLTA